jgi:hypothetical protein
MKGESMRRPEKEIKDESVIQALLDQSPVGRAATINRRGYPVIKPVNYLYWDKRIYFHSSKKGEKINDIRRGSPVCFEIDQPISYVAAQGHACKADYYFRSLILKGRASEIKNRKRKTEILERLMAKYQPEGGYETMPSEIVDKTAVVEILVEEITGKEALG